MTFFKSEPCPTHPKYAHRLVRFEGVGGFFYLPCPLCLDPYTWNHDPTRGVLNAEQVEQLMANQDRPDPIVTALIEDIKLRLADQKAPPKKVRVKLGVPDEEDIWLMSAQCIQVGLPDLAKKLMRTRPAPDADTPTVIVKPEGGDR